MKGKILLLLFFLSLVHINSQERVDETTLKINPDVTVPAPDTPTITTIGVQDYLVMIFVLIMVLGLLYFVLKIIKKIGGNRIGLDNDLINVISTKALRGTTALHLVEVGKQVFLIGATDSSINSISEITDKESRDAIILESSGETHTSESFISMLTKKLKKVNVQSTEEEEAPTSVQSQKEKLDRF